MSEIMRTPLYDMHIELGGSMVDFAGFLLPIKYPSGIITEHLAVRKNAGLFDVSHMGEVIIEGEDAQSFLNYILTNDISTMKDGGIRYSILPNEKGGAVDDILVYRFNAKKYMLVLNASNTPKDIKWISNLLPSSGVSMKDISSETALLALQGPLSQNILEKLTKKDNIPPKYYTFFDNVLIGEVKCLVSRTGYTGEDGFELYCSPKDVSVLCKKIMEAGEEFGISPAGLGARDTLRLEAGMPLYGQELLDDIPINEVGLDFVIKLGKENFIGKSAIEKHIPLYTRVGAEVVGRGIARQGDKVFSGDKEVGYVTSGTHSPSMGRAIAVLRIKKSAVESPDLFVEVRGKKLKVQVVNLPFQYK